MSGEIWDVLRPRQEAVETALRACLSRITRDGPRPLAEAMAYSLLAPGKRLRPLLTVLACEAVGGTADQALPAGVAVEMVHTYSLIHDDLPAMDDDDLRRGLPTCHKKFGDALAILAGDALLTASFELLADSYAAPTAAVSCLELARGAGAGGMVGGQVLDLAAEGRVGNERPPPTVDGLEGIHRRKTGALIRSAVRLGVYAAGQTDTAIVDEYAEAFGLAFQVTDDLLDVQSSAEKTGKRVSKDAVRGKLTYPGLLGVNESRRKADALVDRAVSAADRLGPGGRPLARLAGAIAARDR